MIRIWRQNEVTAHSCFSCLSSEEGDVRHTLPRYVQTHLEDGCFKENIIFTKEKQLFLSLVSSSSGGCAPPITRDSCRRAWPDWQLRQTCSPWLTAGCTTWQLENSLLDCSYVCLYMFRYIRYAFQRSQSIKSSIIKYAFLSNLLLNVTKALSAYNLWLQTLYFNSFWYYSCENFKWKHLPIIPVFLKKNTKYS